MSAQSILAMVATVGLAAFVQAIFGFGFALLVVPVAAVVYGPHEAVTLVTLLGTVVPAGMAWNQRRRIDRPVARRLVVAVLAGTPVGLLVFVTLPSDALRILIGVGVLASALFLWLTPSFDHPGPILDAAAGFLSGALATSTGTNGPPVVLALQARRLPPDPFRATLAVTLLLTNLAVLAVFVLSGELRTSMFGPAIASLPALGLGWFGGAAVRDRIPPHRFDHLVLGLLAVSATVSIVAAVI